MKLNWSHGLKSYLLEPREFQFDFYLLEMSKKWMSIDSCPPQLLGKGSFQVKKASEKAIKCFLVIVKFVYHVCLLSCVWRFATPWTVAHQVPLSMGLSRQEYWSGLLFPPPGDLPDPGIEPTSPVSPADSLPLHSMWSLFIMKSLQYSFDTESRIYPFLLFTSLLYYLNCSLNTHILMARQKVNRHLCISGHIWYMIYHLGCHFLRWALLNWRITRKGNQEYEVFKIISHSLVALVSLNYGYLESRGSVVLMVENTNGHT